MTQRTQKLDTIIRNQITKIS